MRIAICDKVSEDRSQWKHFLMLYFGENYKIDIVEFDSVDGALSEMNRIRPDFIILDLHMEKMDEPEVVKLLQERDYSIKIIATASSGRYAVDAFRIYADGFVCKPLTMTGITEVLNRFKRIFFRHQKKLSLMIERTMRDILLEDIVYMEVCGHSTLIHTTCGDFRASDSLTGVKKKMDGNEMFISCGKSYYVHLKYVADVSRKEIVLRGGEQIYIPIRLQKDVSKKVRDYFEKRNIND